MRSYTSGVVLMRTRPSTSNSVMSHLRLLPTVSTDCRACADDASAGPSSVRRYSCSMDCSVLMREVMMLCMSALLRLYTNHTLNTAMATSVTMSETYTTREMRAW